MDKSCCFKQSIAVFSDYVAMQTQCSAINCLSGVLIAMKKACCFNHVKSHGLSFSWKLTLLDADLYIECVFFVVQMAFTSEESLESSTHFDLHYGAG